MLPERPPFNGDYYGTNEAALVAGYDTDPDSLHAFRRWAHRHAESVRVRIGSSFMLVWDGKAVRDACATRRRSA